MMRYFPFRRDNGAFSDLYDAIAGAKANIDSCLDDFDVRPLKPMTVDVVGDFAEQNTLRFQDPVGLPNERWIEVGEVIPILGG
jgi:hypothetical protein